MVDSSRKTTVHEAAKREAEELSVRRWIAWRRREGLPPLRHKRRGAESWFRADWIFQDQVGNLVGVEHTRLFLGERDPEDEAAAVAFIEHEVLPLLNLGPNERMELSPSLPWLLPRARRGRLAAKLSAELAERPQTAGGDVWPITLDVDGEVYHLVVTRWAGRDQRVTVGCSQSRWAGDEHIAFERTILKKVKRGQLADARLDRRILLIDDYIGLADMSAITSSLVKLEERGDLANVDEIFLRGDFRTGNFVRVWPACP